MAPRQKAKEPTKSDVPVGLNVRLYVSKDDIKKLNASPPDRNLVKALVRVITSAASSNPDLK